MPAMAAPAAPPAGFEVVTPSTPQVPVVRGKDREPAATQTSGTSEGQTATLPKSQAALAGSSGPDGAAPAEPSSTPAPAESGTQVTEPSKLERAQQAAK